MSGVAAVIHADGRAVEPDVLRDLVLGPEADAASAIATWNNGPIGLAVGALAARRDEGVHIEHAHPLVAVFDGRLDNRAELIAQLGAPQPTDGQLLVAAFQRWGVACVERFVGDFACIVYDRDARRLVAARDQLGIRPLHYAVDGTACYIASRIDRLRHRANVGAAVDERVVSGFLVGRLDDAEATFFDGVRRVPPGHVLTMTGAGDRTVHAYWKPDTSRSITYAKDAEYVEQLRELLGQAIASRLTSASRPGLLLSGGLDSMAVLWTIDRLNREQPILRDRLATVTATFADVPDESRDVAARLDARFDAVEVAGSPNWTFDPDSGRTPAWHEPLEGMYVVTYGRLLAGAAATGIDALLTGYGGDLVLAGNYYYLFDLFDERRWPALSRELGSYALQRRVLLAAKYILRPLLLRRPSELWNYAVPDWVAEPFAQRTDLASRARRPALDVSATGGISQRAELASIDITQHAARMLWQQSEALQHGIELRHPFFDRRLFEFLLAVPATQKIQRGKSKALLRLAVPDAVPRALPPDSASVRTASSARALRERERANWDACFARSRAAESGYVDAVRLRKAFRRYLDGDITLKYALARTFRLEWWLQQISKEPSMSDQRVDRLDMASEKTSGAYEPPKVTRHGKLAEVTQTSPPDALDSTMRPGERPRSE